MSDLKWGELDHRGEFDELWMINAHVHIERMSETSFWIGIMAADGSGVMVNTGVHRGQWFFRVEGDKQSHVVQRPRRKAKEPRP